MLTSPLRRAVETCELAGLGGQAQARDDLREWDYGDYEGMTTAEIHRRRPGWSLWRDGCPNGETAADVGARADRVIAEVRAADGDAVAFGHGHMLRVLGRPLARASAPGRRPVRACHRNAEHARLRARHRRDPELERAAGLS